MDWLRGVVFYGPVILTFSYWPRTERRNLSMALWFFFLVDKLYLFFGVGETELDEA